MARNIIVFIGILLGVGLFAQSAQNQKGASLVAANKQKAKPEPKSIQWLTFEQAQKLGQTTKKKIFVDVYTDWCGWCKRMDTGTFASPEIVDYVNEHYYAVKFNAEQKESIEWNGKTYKNTGTGGRSAHEFAVYLLNNRLSYPTTVFLAEDLNMIQPLPGYMEAQKLEPILHYFGSDSHKRVAWDQYQVEFAKRKG
jgi:thioredoxin-related protein